MKYPEVLSLGRGEAVFDYDRKTTMLYALAVGCSAEGDDLPFVYEKDLKALPTLPAIMGGGSRNILDEAGLDRARLVHGEQRLTIHRPLPPEGRLMSRPRVLGVTDKGAGKGSLLYTESTLCDEDGVRHATSIVTLFCRGDGGFGGPAANVLPPLPKVPERAPDFEVAIATRPEQAALYRLMGDYNPLHIDPKFAARAGFPRPILHGLCTYAIAARAIIRSCASNDPAMIEVINARFSAPTFPGETIVTRIWKSGGSLAFECIARERKVTVISNGECRLRA